MENISNNNSDSGVYFSLKTGEFIEVEVYREGYFIRFEKGKTRFYTNWRYFHKFIKNYERIDTYRIDNYYFQPVILGLEHGLSFQDETKQKSFLADIMLKLGIK